MHKRILTVVAMVVSSVVAGAEPAKIESLYQSHCAVCHGDDLSGGLGGSLVDGVWAVGDSDAAIQTAIAEGNPEMGMEAFGDVLSGEDLRAMVIYLREQEKRHAVASMAFPVPTDGAVTSTRLHAYRMESVAEGLSIPWAIAFLPDGRKLVTERPGSLRIIDADGKLMAAPVAGIPAVTHHGQGGLMDVIAHPGDATNGWIYMALADGWQGAGGKDVRALTAIVRGRVVNHTWVDNEWVWRGATNFYSGSGAHFGSRIVFDEAGYVFFVVGERGGWHEAQDLKRPNGKIYRLHDDGRVPVDNPFVAVPEAIPGIWSYGHRNPQGLARDPRDGGLYATEHGARGGDEFNRINKGANYGWPVITHGMNYNGTPITGETAAEGMEQPLVHWTPSIAACGLACYVGTGFPRWQHDFLVGGLAQQEVRRVRVTDGKVVEQEIILKNVGRVRDVKCGPDGHVYVVLNSPDRVVRLVPADAEAGAAR